MRSWDHLWQSCQSVFVVFYLHFTSQLAYGSSSKNSKYYGCRCRFSKFFASLVKLGRLWDDSHNMVENLPFVVEDVTSKFFKMPVCIYDEFQKFLLNVHKNTISFDIKNMFNLSLTYNVQFPCTGEITNQGMVRKIYKFPVICLEIHDISLIDCVVLNG